MSAPSLNLHVDATPLAFKLYTYPARSPIGQVRLGPLDVNVYSADQAREIAAAFTQLADNLQKYEDTHCPECFTETVINNVHTPACSRGVR